MVRGENGNKWNGKAQGGVKAGATVGLPNHLGVAGLVSQWGWLILSAASQQIRIAAEKLMRSGAITLRRMEDWWVVGHARAGGGVVSSAIASGDGR